MSATTQIRRAEAQDQATIVAFNQAMAEETEGKRLDPAVLTAGVRAALADPSACRYYMAETDGVIAGQTMVTFEWSDWRNGTFWWIQSVYVDLPFRRRGVFRSLYQHIRNEAQASKKVCGLRLYVDKDNTRAQHTYLQLGMNLTNYLICEEGWPSGE